MKTNRERARRAESALEQYNGNDMREDGPDGIAETLADMLGDLRHMARFSGVDFDACAARGLAMSEMEREEDEDGDEDGNAILFVDEFREEEAGVAQAVFNAFIAAGERIVSAEFPKPMEFPSSTDFEDSRLLAMLCADDTVDGEADAARAVAICGRLRDRKLRVYWSEMAIAGYARCWNLPYWMVYSAVRN